MPTAWEETRRELRAELGAMFDIWVDPLAFHGIDSGRGLAYLVAPNAAYVAWLEAQYMGVIEAALQRHFDADALSVRFCMAGGHLPDLGSSEVSPDESTCAEAASEPVRPSVGVPAALFPDLPDVIEPAPSRRSRSGLSALPQAARRYQAPASEPVAAVAEAAPAQPSLFDRVPPVRSEPEASFRSQPPLATPLPLDKTFEKFVVGDCNQFAHAAALAVGDGPTGSRYNPLFIYGGTGLGKTHLMVAIGHRRLQRDPTARVLYVTGEQFTNELIEALRYKQTARFRQKYRQNVDLLLVDDVQFFGGKERTQAEFFHTFESLVSKGRQIVFTADVLPRDIPHFHARLRTRCESGMLADMQPPDHETLVAIVRDKAANASVELSHDVARWIAARVRGSIRELEGVVHRIAALRDLYRESVTLPFVRAHLGNVLPDGPPSPEAEDILQAVATTFDVTRSQLLGPQRTRRLVRPRHVAMFLVRKHTGESLPDIGRRFDRDHTTVHHACNKIERLLNSDVELRQQVHVVERTLGC